MMGSEASRWVTSILFAASTLGYLAIVGNNHLRGDRLLGGRAGACLHAVMAAAMITMLWTWGTAIPSALLVVVFAAATLWFIACALFAPLSRVKLGRAESDGSRFRGGFGEHAHGGGPWYHAAMMASMVWMVAAMSAMPVMADAAASSGSMAGMDMGPTSGMSHGGSPWWVRDGCALLFAAFVLAAVWRFGIVLRACVGPRAARQRALIGDGMAVVMAVGMAIVFLNMT